MAEIKEALGLGVDFPLSNGTTIQVVPCSIADLEDAITHYTDWFNAQKTFQGLFFPGNEKPRSDFEWLLIKANGKDVPQDDEERKALAKTVLLQFGDLNVDGAQEVYRYIDRFLGFVPRNTPAEVEQE